MDYLENEKSKRLSGGASSPKEVVLPKQQFYFSSTSVADAYTPPAVRPETKKPSKLLMGPRPWGAASQRDSRDGSVALDEYDTKNGIETDQNSNYRDSYSKSGARTTSSFHSDSSTVSPRRERSSGELGPRSELGFSPRPESESDSILEEKSISMMAYSNQSEPRNGVESGRRESFDDVQNAESEQRDDVSERYENSKASLQVGLQEPCLFPRELQKSSNLPFHHSCCQVQIFVGCWRHAFVTVLTSWRSLDQVVAIFSESVRQASRAVPPVAAAAGGKSAAAEQEEHHPVEQSTRAEQRPAHVVLRKRGRTGPRDVRVCASHVVVSQVE